MNGDDSLVEDNGEPEDEEVVEEVVEEDEQEVATGDVPFAGQTFKSWAEASSCLERYAKSHCFQWSTDTSCCIANENLKCAAKGETPYKVELVHKNIKMTCVSGGKVRINQGSGQRPFQSTWKTGCPAMVHLIASKKENVLKIKTFVPNHNHTCDKDYFILLPKTRQESLKEAKAASTTDTLFKAGVKPSVVRSVLREMGCGQVTARDLSNLRASLKAKQRQGKSAEEKLIDTLEKIQEADPGTFIHVGETAEKKLSYLFIQTSSMRRNMQKFGKVLLMDHTYKINRHRMPVTVLMTQDGHGDGRSVGYAFIANENSATIKDVLTAFKEGCGGDVVTDKIATVVIDKDYTEVKPLKTVFPRASIQLCDFHVSRTFKARCKKEVPEVKRIVDEMRYCLNDEAFQRLAADLVKVASADFMSYFNDNWICCPMAWSFRDKKKVSI